MPTGSPVPVERVFLIRLQNLEETLPPPQAVAMTIASRSLHMALIPEIDDRMMVVVERELPNTSPHEIYDRIQARPDSAGRLRVFDADGHEQRRYVLSEEEGTIIEGLLMRQMDEIVTVHRSRQLLMMHGVPLLWTIDRFVTPRTDKTARTVPPLVPDMVIGSVQFPRDALFPQADWVVEEVTDSRSFCLPKIVRLYPRVRR